MATPKPGEIRCPTCHRSTPPAAFCTQCGSAIPADARARPRGMDRDELQDRIRARRSGGDPYRRGEESEEGTGVYERFEPDPNDSMRRPAPGPAEPRRDLLDESAQAAPPPTTPARQPDLTREPDDWSRAPAPAPAWTAAAPSQAPGDQPAGSTPPDDAAPAPEFDEGYDYGEPYPEWDQQPERSGAGTWAIVGFLALGVLALLAGAALASLWGGAVGQGEATPRPEPSALVSSEPSLGPSVAPSATPQASASGGPITFPDGFAAEAQPCIPGSVGESGCGSNAVSNSGSVDIWVGFQNGTRNDVLAAILVAPDGRTYDQAIDLARIGCGSICSGYTRFGFSSLPPGEYEVRITRNGEPAGSTNFEVVS